MSGAAFSDLHQTAGGNGANRGATGPSRPLREGPAPSTACPHPQDAACPRLKPVLMPRRKNCAHTSKSGLTPTGKTRRFPLRQGSPA